MKRFILFVLSVFYFSGVFCADYTRLDKQSESVPVRLKTAPEITAYLTRNLTSPAEKVRAIYYWIAHNIRYDVVKMKMKETYINPQELVDYALAKKEGVCANYTALFNVCCLSVGVQSYVVEGYVRQNGKLILNGHSWNVIKIGNRFYDIDVTWASGYVENDRFYPKFRDEFFMISPTEFIKTHMPNDPIWQLSSNPVTFKEFDAGNFQKQLVSSSFNFSDSITAISHQNLLEQLQHKQHRIIHCGITNSFIKSILGDLYKEIENEELRLQTEKYNLAVTQMNKGVSEYNQYVVFRKKSAIRTKDDVRMVLNLLKSAREKTLEASQLISDLKTNNQELSTQIKRFKKDIETKFTDIDAEISYISGYKTNI